MFPTGKFPQLLASFLALSALACGGGTEPVADPVAAKLSLTTPPSAQARSRLRLTQQPVVQLRDANDHPAEQAGTVVTVSVSGEASLSGGSAVPTSGTGVAAFTDLSIAGVAGEKTLTFSAPEVSSATFTLTLTAGPAAQIAGAAGNNQFADVGTAVPTPPAISITDADGNGVSGVVVIFAVDSGGGIIEKETESTDAAGVATVGNWILGAAPGSNTLIATAEPFPERPVIFMATGIPANPCRRASSSLIALETAVSGALEGGDCVLHGGQFHDFYNFTIATQQAVVVSLHAEDYDPALDLFTFVDQRFRGTRRDTVNATREARLKVILPPGRYETAASSDLVGDAGPYTLRVSTTAASAESCEVLFVVRGITTAQHLASTDCLDDSESFYGDIFDLWLEAGERVKLTQSSSDLTPQLLLFRTGSGELVAQGFGDSPGTVDLDYEAQATDRFLIVATSGLFLESGAYTLSISDPPAAGTGNMAVGAATRPRPHPGHHGLVDRIRRSWTPGSAPRF